MHCYLVGGAVRDRLLGLPVVERDWVVVGATPETMIEQGFRPVGRDFPVFIEPGSGEEYALARTERKTAPGHQGFHFHAAPDVTLEQDLLRRDLTINAMAEDADGNIIDPCGGQADLEARCLRHVSPAFVEDPLRVLRVARFAARLHHLGFRIAAETLELMADLVRSGELQALAPERVWKELELSLLATTPKVFFDVLRQVGALTVLLPPLAPLPADHPAFLTLARSEQVTAELAPPSLVPWIALVAAAVREQDRLPLASEPVDDEAAGRRAVALCAALRTPREHRDAALALARMLMPLTLPAGLDAEALLQAAMGCDAARRPTRLAAIAVAVQRLLAVLDASPARQQAVAEVLAALPAAMQVDVADLQQQGRQGAAMGAAVRQRRLAAVAALLEQVHG